MRKAIVIYKSVSGFTKRYAKWIAKALDADIEESGNATIGQLLKYDVIIFGGSLHAVGINGIGIVKSNLSRLAGKKIVVFAVGASPPNNHVIGKVINRNFQGSERRRVRVFYLRGGFDYSKLDLKNKLVMSIFGFVLRDKKDRTEDENGMLSAYEKPADFTDRRSIRQLVKYVKGVM